MVLELGGTVGEPVTLLSRDVAAPVADFDIPLKKRGMCEGLGELVAHADFFLSTRRKLTVWTVSEGIALLLRVLLALSVELSGKNSSVRDIGCRELELGLLLQGCVCARRVGGELVQDVLLVVLLDLGREGLEGGENKVGDREGELLLGGQRCREVDLVVLGRASVCQRCVISLQSLPPCFFLPSLVQRNDLNIERRL